MVLGDRLRLLRQVLVAVVAAGLLMACGSRVVSDETSRELQLALDPEAYAAATDAYSAAYFESLSECMVQEGFEYYPYVTELVQGPVDNREIRRESGFRIATEIGRIDPEFSRTLERTDLNEEYWSSLDDSAQTAYGAAQASCSDAANRLTESLFPGSPGSSDAASEWLEDARTRAQADPRYVDASGWGNCMAGRGYDYTTPEEGFQDIVGNDRVNEYLAAWSQAVSDGSSAGSLPTAQDVFSAGELEDIGELKKREIEYSLADWDCGGNSELVLQEILLEYLDQ